MRIRPINYFHSFIQPKPQKQGNKTNENNFTNPFSFKGFACAKETFAPRNIYAMPCASCGEKTIQTRQLDMYVRKIKDLRGNDLVYELQQRASYCRELEGRIMKNIIFEALSDKDKDLKAIIGTLSTKYMTELIGAQVKVLDAVEKNSKSFKEETKKAIKQYLDEQKELILHPDYENEKYFRRQAFIEELKAIVPADEQNDDTSFLFETAEKIPASSNSESAFYASFSKKTNEDIARRLFSGALASTEHVKPSSKGGKNDTSNYIVMCADCNSRRSDMPYSEWITRRPNFKVNFDKYLQEVEGKIETGEIGEEYSTYPKEILETFSLELGENVKRGKREKKVEVAQIEPLEDKTQEQMAERILKLEKSVDSKRKELTELKSKFEEYSASGTFRALQKLSSEEQTLESLRQTAARIRKELADVKVEQKRFSQKKKQLERTLEELKQAPTKKSEDVKITQESVAERKEQLEKTKRRLKKTDRKCKQLDAQVAELKEEEIKYSAQIKSLSEDIKAQKAMVRLPAVINAEIVEMEAEIGNLDTLKLRFQKLLDKKAAADESEISAARLIEEFKELDKEIAALTKAKPSIRTSSEHLKQYYDLKDKADKIHRLQSEEYVQKTKAAQEQEEALLNSIINLNNEIMKNFNNISISDKRNVAKYEGLTNKLAQMKTMFKKYQASRTASNNASKYDFILAEALESIEAKIAEMSSNPEIKLLSMQDSRKELQAKIKQEQAIVKSGAGLEKQIAKLREQIKQSEDAIEVNKTKEKLKELKHELELMQEMLDNLDIDDTISALENEIINLAQNLSKLQNEKRRLANIEAQDEA